MHGNVWEWTQDYWNENYVGAPSDGSPWMQGDYSKRVLRGGSWFFSHQVLRSASRSGLAMPNRLEIIGFRVARNIKTEDIKRLPFSSNYARKIIEFFTSKLVLHKPFMGNPSAEVEINCDPDGSIISWQITKLSENEEWNEIIRKTVEKTKAISKIPKDIDGRVPSKLFVKLSP
ncbi:MAG: SUMF1/EgtB/PvdO family nonheme iron enzyme [Betaproteobacteria bacterium]